MTDMYEQMNHFYPLAIYFLFPFNLLARDIERPSNLKKYLVEDTLVHNSTLDHFSITRKLSVFSV